MKNYVCCNRCTGVCNTDQGRGTCPLMLGSLPEPKDLPELEKEKLIGWVWIASLVALIALCIALLAGSAWIARKYKAYQAKETVAQAICFEKYGQYGQWRYESDSELWCSSAVTGAVRVVLL
jgi:hypothetical protein